jgi:hypothetical protein
MRVSTLRFIPGAIALIAVLFAAPARSHADSYEIIALHSDDGYHFGGISDSGEVVLNSIGYGGTYFTYQNGVITGTSSNAPFLAADNGTACTPSLPGAVVLDSVCNNGHVAFAGYLSGNQFSPDDYTGSAANPSATTLSLGPSYGAIYMNSVGDIVFDDVYTEEWYEAIDFSAPVTSNELNSADDLAASPVGEPASILLLGTGALVAMGLSRRRMTVQN